MFAQWVCGPQVVLYEWVWSKLHNYSMNFRPKMHDFVAYLTIVHLRLVKNVVLILCFDKKVPPFA